MSRKVRELVYNAGERVTADLVQGREQHGLLQPASPVVLHRRPAIPRRQPTHMPRLDAPLMKGHVYFIPLTPAGPEELLEKKNTQSLTALKQIQDASLSSGWFNLRGAVILRSRHIFCFSKHGGLCAAVHWRRCLPKSIQIQPDRAQPGEKGEEKTRGKVGESTNKNPENTTTTCGSWTRSPKHTRTHTQDGLPATPRSLWSGLMENRDRMIPNGTGGARTEELEEISVRLKTPFYLALKSIQQ